jgi:hypothetical protein
MRKKVIVAILCITTLVAGTLIEKGSSQSWKDKLNKNIEKKNEEGGSESVKDGCMDRKLIVQQISLGGDKWSSPQFVPRPGYTDNAYRFVTCQDWVGSTKLSSSMKKSGISESQLVNACGTSYPHINKNEKIYVQTEDNAEWDIKKEADHPFRTYREIAITCYAKSTLNNKCNCR